MVATMLFQSAIQLSHHVCIKWIQVVTCLSLRHAQTLDKNGSLIDPSGTESPHVQIWLETMQVQVVDQTTHPPKCHSFVALDRQISASPPARRREKKERFYIYLFRCYTHTDIHTHTWPEPGKPWKARGREKRTQTTGQGRNSAGGEGNKRTSRTNLHGETDLTNTGHTPEPHNTFPRGTGEELGTEWGTSWWRKWNNKIINEGDPALS